MKKKELQKYREKDAKALTSDISALRDEIKKAYLDSVSGKATNTRKYKGLRHDLARLLTIKTEKEMEVKESKK